MLGAEPAEHGILKMDQARARIEQLIRQYSLAVDLAAKVESITVGIWNAAACGNSENALSGQ